VRAPAFKADNRGSRSGKPANERTCFQCGEVGHMKFVCKVPTQTPAGLKAQREMFPRSGQPATKDQAQVTSLQCGEADCDQVEIDLCGSCASDWQFGPEVPLPPVGGEAGDTYYMNVLRKETPRRSARLAEARERRRRESASPEAQPEKDPRTFLGSGRFLAKRSKDPVQMDPPNPLVPFLPHPLNGFRHLFPCSSDGQTRFRQGD
jgi:hypothetical protein